MTTPGKQDFAFTDYVRSLNPMGEPDPAAFDAAWQKLRRVLRSELRRRSLATAPPSYLGVYGSTSWDEPGAFEELVQDCFTWVFVERLASLEALLEELPHIEMIVFKYIRDFLYTRQKKHDPLGFRIFEVLRRAVRRMIRDNALHVLDGDPKIRNGTVPPA